MAGDITYPNFGAQTNWLLRLQVLNWINDNNLGNTAPYAAYKTALAATSEGKIAQMSVDADAWYASQASQQAQIDALWVDLLAIMDSGEQSETVWNTFEAKRAQLETLHTAYQNSFAQFLATLQAAVDALPTTQPYEQNFRDVQSMWLDMYDREPLTITAQEKSLLESIAEQCPMAGGPAVYGARGILSRFDEYSYDDEGLCQPGEPREINNDAAKTNRMQVFPNPNNGIFQIVLPAAEQPYNLYLYDQLGRLSIQHTLIAGTHQIAMPAHFSKGIYLLRIEAFNRDLTGQQMLILH